MIFSIESHYFEVIDNLVKYDVNDLQTCLDFIEKHKEELIPRITSYYFEQIEPLVKEVNENEKHKWLQAQRDYELSLINDLIEQWDSIEKESEIEFNDMPEYIKNHYPGLTKYDHIENSVNFLPFNIDPNNLISYHYSHKRIKRCISCGVTPYMKICRSCKEKDKKTEYFKEILEDLVHNVFSLLSKKLFDNVNIILEEKEYKKQPTMVLTYNSDEDIPFSTDKKRREKRRRATNNGNVFW